MPTARLLALLAALLLAAPVAYAQTEGGSLYDQATAAFRAGEYAKAEGLCRKARSKEEPGSSEFASLLTLEADCMDYQGRSTEAEPLHRQAVAILEKSGKTDTPEYAASLTSLAFNLDDQGRYPEAEALYRHLLAILEKQVGASHPEYAMTANNLAVNLDEQGLYKQSEALYRQSLAVLKSLLGVEDPDVAATISNLALNLSEQGRFAEAEPFSREAISIYEAISSEASPDYASSINNLALNLDGQGRHLEAETLYRRSFDIRVSIFGEEHPVVASSLNNLAFALQAQELYKEAETLLRKARAVVREFAGTDHPAYASSLSSLAGNLKAQGRLKEAEPLLREALAIRKKALGEQHPNYAASLNNLAGNLAEQGQFDQAEPYYKAALVALRSSLGEVHPNYARTQQSLAVHLSAQTRYAEAEPLFRDALHFTFDHYRANQEGLSEAQRQQLYETGLGSSYRWLLSRCALRPEHATPAYAWGWHLNLRGLQLQTSARLQARVATSGDTTLQAAFAAWRNQREYLAALYNLTTDELARRRVDLSAEEAKATELERDLSRRSTAFAEATDTTRITWQQVAALLKPNEGVVDIARFGHDSTAGYLVFLYRHGWEGPRTLVIPTALWLETAGLRLYRTNVAKASPEAVVFQRFWAPIDSALGPVDKLYLAVDGVYNQVNVNTLQRPSGQYILEETEVVQVGSFRDLVLPPTRPETPQAALVVGRPAYNLDAATFEQQFVADNADRGGITDLVGAQWSDLPGTEREARAIAEVFTGQRYRTTLLLGAEANEATVKATQQPRVLHVATHGFFVPKPEASPKGQKASAPVVFRSGTDDFGGGAYNFDRDPLLRSGIVLAGVSNAATDKRQLKEDGVLTAYEAGTLNLQGTELVVLSACETGLGELQAGEGIYGLQRSIQLAGARSVLTSLWRVDDTATQLLMTEFYGRWLAGKTKRQAFAEAQAVIRQQYPEPLYWGAFVLVGE